MQTVTIETAPLGELVVAAFDRASEYAVDPRVVLQLASTLLQRTLRRSPQRSVPVRVRRRLGRPHVWVRP